jgi:hypothetical protein
MADFLTFKFAPHILEDLGVNLYTTLPKALVEFVANSHDADATGVSIALDPDLITKEMETLRINHKHEKKQLVQTPDTLIVPLNERALPDSVTIVIEDDGHGMSRNDLESKFLVVGRRRRKGVEKSARTQNGRIVMGRKGLGKLAGFGIAHLIEVISKVESSSSSTKITLDLEALLGEKEAMVSKTEAEKEEKEKTEQEETSKSGDPTSSPQDFRPIKIPVEEIENDETFPRGQGTRIVLRRLVYDGLKGELIKALTDSLAENFYGIRPQDFEMRINTNPVDTKDDDFAFSWPSSALPPSELVEGEIPNEEGQAPTKFKFRIRFRGPKRQLPAKQRGIRVYAHHRLASVPDLLDVKSSAHGFQYTSYLDGVVVADWIDEQKTDYISTDRQNLRWETPILNSLRAQLTSEITKALAKYADLVSENIENKLKTDEYTKTIIEGSSLPDHRQRTFWAIAKALAGKDSGDLDSEFYKSTIKSVANGLGHGQILSTIHDIAQKDQPELQSVISEITRLTYQEFGDFLQIIEGRLKAINALRRICKDVDFLDKKNEKPLHQLFKRNTWLIDPTFFEFLTSDQDERTVAKRLSNELGIAGDANSSKSMNTEERPDLCFLIGSASLRRFVIIEFKAPNVPLQSKHLNQLKGYITRAKKWLKSTMGIDSNYRVEGILIGSKDFEGRKSDEFIALEHDIGSWVPSLDWRVWDILEVLESAENVHRELLEVSKTAAKYSTLR